MYDFVDPAPGKGRVTPYGVYDPAWQAWPTNLVCVAVASDAPVQ